MLTSYKESYIIKREYVLQNWNIEFSHTHIQKHKQTNKQTYNTTMLI